MNVKQVPYTLSALQSSVLTLLVIKHFRLILSTEQGQTNHGLREHLEIRDTVHQETSGNQRLIGNRDTES